MWRIEEQVRGGENVRNPERLPVTMIDDLVAVGFGPDELFNLAFADLARFPREPAACAPCMTMS